MGDTSIDVTNMPEAELAALIGEEEAAGIVRTREEAQHWVASPEAVALAEELSRLLRERNKLPWTATPFRKEPDADDEYPELIAIMPDRHTVCAPMSVLRQMIAHPPSDELLLEMFEGCGGLGVVPDGWFARHAQEAAHEGA